MQHGRMIAYASGPLGSHKMNYPNYNLELAAIIFALKIWRHCLYGKKSARFLRIKRVSNICLFRGILILGNEGGLSCLVIMIARPG